MTSSENPGLIALIMAAGLSRRYGSDKRFARINDQYMIQHAINALSKANLTFKLVCRPDDMDTSFFQQFTTGQCIVSHNHHQGIGASISAGIQSIQADYSHCLICLADMPYIKAQTYQAIAAHCQTEKALAVIPRYQNTTGNPVAISAKLYKDFIQLSADKGGKAILQQYHQHTKLLDVDDPGILQDIDQPHSATIKP